MLQLCAYIGITLASAGWGMAYAARKLTGDQLERAFFDHIKERLGE